MLANTMSFWFAAAYDKILAPAERLCLRTWRKELLTPLQGRVLELGAGTGKNLIHYPDTLEALVLAEPDSYMRTQLERHLQAHPDLLRVEVSAAHAECLPFDTARFEHVVGTLVFCSVRDLRQSLIETHRVLVPGGRLHLIEHIAAPIGSARRKWQTRLDPLWSRVAEGCHLDRDPRPILEELGYREERTVLDELRGVPAFQSVVLRGSWFKP
jgi:ubiquinone/menaquinone biosynthesis C-methylase UbiE